MDELHAEAHALDQLANNALAGDAAALAAQLAVWRQGITERGARKFLRGLSETPGASEGATALDDEIARLEARTAGVAAAGTSATARTARLRDAAAFAARVAGLWHGLALKTHEDQSCDSLLQPLAEAEALLAIEPPLAGLTFANPPEDVDAARLPELPKALWVSALYHVLHAVAEVAHGAEARVVSRIRPDGDKLVLVVQIAAGALLPRRGGQQAYHLEIARAMLAPFGIAVSALPTLDGPYPAALAWSATEPYRRAAGAQPPATSTRANHLEGGRPLA
jgi:hypothetical protein